jgi:hypothetical protein
MSIDRIGKPPVPTVSNDAKAPSTERAGESFGNTLEKVAGKEGAPVDAAEGAHVSATENALFQKVQKGEVSVKDYVAAKVDAATAHLSHLPASAQAEVKDMLRAKLETDPALQALLKSATGHVSSVDEG